MTEDQIAGPVDASRRKFLASVGAVGALGLSGCTQDPGGGDDGEDLSGEVVVTGSSTVFPISDAMAEQFMEEHSDVNVTVDSTGSGGGFENHFCPGNAAVNGSSRPIKDSEIEHCNSNDVQPVEFHVGGDALTVAVNNDAEWVDCVTFGELSQIWRKDGAETWSDVRDDWPDETFDLYGPASTSGTFDWFNEHVIGEQYGHTSKHEPTEDDNLIVKGIEDSKNAMGYFGYAYYSENADRVKAVKIRKDDGGECTEPNLENAKDGSYPMARPLFIYASESAIQRDVVYEFLKFYLEQAQTDLVSNIGYVPSSEQQRDDNLAKLDEHRG